MKIYWFMDDGGETCNGIAAQSEETAWEIFAKDNRVDGEQPTGEQLAKVREDGSYRIVAITEVTDTEGTVAKFYLREGDVYIKASFGSEQLGHLEAI